MQRNEGNERIWNAAPQACRHVAPIQFRAAGCWALFGLALLMGCRAGPARAAGLDILWTRSVSTARRAFVALSPDGKTVASGTEKIQLWRAADGSLVRTLAKVQGALSVTFSPDSQTLAAGDLYGSGRLWNVSDGQLLSTFDREAVAFAFSPDNRMVAVMGKGDTVQLLGLNDPTPVRAFEAGPQGFFPYLALSPDGQFLATGTADVKLWRVGDGQLLHTFSGIRVLPLFC